MSARAVPIVPAFLSGQKLTATTMNLLGTWMSFWSDPPMFRMYQSVAQSVPNATNTQITMDIGSWDTDSGRSGSSPYSYTIPTGMTGRWRFTWAVEWVLNATGSRAAILYRNGSPALGDTEEDSASNDATSEIGTATVLVNAGDVMSVWAWQNSGGNLSTLTNSQFASFFEGELRSLANP